eukprot:CAMPEP_0117041734 /NCGR_PEP_ID=MMETSP0472-20121206/29118_1 /TAXON_ID=693140 ORGANISM="Tiarina fusus, Strain LIS" /NCGR_SAMPLE_ID=MMETSP0472 /ASSEMBLY_ACC=CAM_ASM_000603 /LENGTH=115 /DNA_ID=CAMNT_0004752807 /DNA_START=75 /DNA_END=422 /DNA_ORIENTATION=+
MPPKKDPKKDAKSKTQAQQKKSSSGGSKAKKKKWSKGKVKEKLNNAVFLEKGVYDKMIKEMPKTKMITPSIVSDRLKVNVSVARRGIKELLAKGLIKEVSAHSSQTLYTRTTAGA